MRRTIIAFILSLCSINGALADEPIELEIKGPLTQGALILAKSEPGVTATLNDELLQVTEQGYIVLVSHEKLRLKTP